MHGALLPMHDQFLPKEKPAGPGMAAASAVGQAGNRIWSQLLGRSGKKRQTTAIRILAVILLVITGLQYYYCGGGRSVALSDTDADETVYAYDFNAQTTSSVGAAAKKERVLLLIPLRNAENMLDLMWSHLNDLTYPHELIDVAFLVSDSTDNTASKLTSTGSYYAQYFGSVNIYNRDFNAVIGQEVDARHGVAVQAQRRKLMARARNWLLSVALRPEHSWVMWRDADIERSPPSILEDLMKHDHDVIVPNVWRPLPKWLGGQQPYDLNAWQESDAALELAKTLHEDDVIVEGYAEYPTWRIHLAYLRNDEGTGDMDDLIELDGIGGVTILAKAHVFRAGANFPGFAFESHAETEGFGKMCRRMGFSVGGLTQYTIWHAYEPGKEDLLQMEERKRQGLPID